MLIDIFQHLGASGVYTFLILSGWLYALKRKKPFNADVKDSLQIGWMHVKKLYPLHIIMACVAAVGKWETIIAEPIKYAVYFILNFTLLQSWLPITSLNNSYNGPSWYLSSFFACWVLLTLFNKPIYYIGQKKKSFSIMLLIGIVTLQLALQAVMVCLPKNILPINFAIYADWVTYYSPLWCFLMILVGILFGYIVSDFNLNKNASTLLAGIIFTITLVLFVTEHFLTVNSPILVIYEAIICLGIFAIKNDGSIFAKILSSNVLVYIGNISGYIFLIHGAVNYCLRAFVLDSLGKPQTFVLSVCITLFLTLLIDALSKIRARNSIAQ